MVESHDETPASTENSPKPEENSNEVTEKTQLKTDEPVPNPSSTEVPKETNSINAKTIQWEQKLKSDGFVLCVCRTGFQDLKCKNLLKFLQTWPD